MSDRNHRREFLQTAGVTAAGLVASYYPAGTPLQAAAAPVAARTMGARFRELLQKRDTFQAIAAYDLFAARLIEELGFPALFMGGSLTGDFYAQPVWLNDLSERIGFVRHITERVEIPALVDVDDGGDPMTIYRVTKELERARAGAIHILDDMAAPMGRVTACIPVERMIDKIHAAVDARSDLVVTARCNAANPQREGKDKAIERGIKYAEAGAESIWFTGIPLAELVPVADAIRIPITAQLIATNTVADAKAAKVTVAIYASLLQNIAQSAVYDALTELKTAGTMTKAAGGQRLGARIPPEFRAKIVRTDELNERGKKYNVL